jgi:hypothetical protein
MLVRYVESAKFGAIGPFQNADGAIVSINRVVTTKPFTGARATIS